MTLKTFCNVPEEILFENIRVNSKRELPWIGMTDAHDGHAVIVGGGTSVKNCLDEIKWRQSLGQKIFALNGAANFLAEHQIDVDYTVILDAREENKSFIGVAREFLLASQCHPTIFDLAGEPVKLWHAKIEGLEKLLPTERGNYTFVGGGTTVGLSAMCLVYIMGYRKIHLYGYDSCHTEGASHAYQQTESNSEKNFLVDIEAVGKRYKATVAMAKQAQLFSDVVNMLAQADCEITVHGEGVIPTIAKEMQRIANERTLTAVYDLEVSPPTYDFISFLCAAEGHRLEHGLDKIDVIFQPGSMDGFRDDNLPPDLATRQGMLWRVCVAACRLLPSVKNVCVLQERLPIQGHIFPQGWTVETPISHYGVRLFKDNPKCLMATQSARRAVKQDKKYVTITLRQCDYWPERNSRVDEWAKVDFALNHMGYSVILIPDTGRFSDDYILGSEIFKPASWDIDLRLALYEGAFCNLLVNGGPIALFLHSNAPYIAFKQIVPSCPSTTEEFWNANGVKVGDQLSGNGVMTWLDDTYENIMEAFNNFVKEKENGNTLKSIRGGELSTVDG